ncbi:hypothetical protein AX289_28015 [Methylorubrum populi]|nr:hypothetical protein AX289_28015 [Methylorubrum populi]
MSDMLRMMVTTHMNATVRKAGARKPIDISLRIDVPADIVVANEAEAPTVLRTKHVEKGAAVVREYRGFDGRLFEPVRFGDRDSPVTAEQFGALLALQHEPDTWRSPFATVEEKFASPDSKKPVATRTLPHERDTGFREVVKDDRAERMAEVARASVGFLVVDGIVHRECMAPRWIVRETDKRKLSMVAETSPDWPSMDAFAIGRAAEAYAYLALKAKHLRTSSEIKLGAKDVDQAGLPLGDALALSGCSAEGEVPPSCNDAVAVAAAYGRALAVETAPFLGALPRPAVDPWIEARDVARQLGPFDEIEAGVVFAAADEFNEIMRETELNAADQKKRQEFLRKVVEPVRLRLTFEDVPQPTAVPDLGEIGEFTP